jgi:hypothetical protein
MSNRDEMRDVNRLVPSEETLVGRLQAENAALRGAVTPGNLLDHEYRAAGSPRGWTWVEAIRMWRRQQDIECDEWRQRAEAAGSALVKCAENAAAERFRLEKRIEQLEAWLRKVEAGGMERGHESGCTLWNHPDLGEFPCDCGFAALLAAQPPEE